MLPTYVSELHRYIIAGLQMLPAAYTIFYSLRGVSREKIRVANSRIGFQGVDKKHIVKVCSGKTVNKTESKVIIPGDSHWKGSVRRIGNYLSKNIWG